MHSSEAAGSKPDSSRLGRAAVDILCLLFVVGVLVICLRTGAISRNGIRSTHTGRLWLAAVGAGLATMLPLLVRVAPSAVWPWRRGSRSRDSAAVRVYYALLTATCTAGLFNYYQFDGRSFWQIGDHADVTYYYLNSKYFQELGYFDLYPAMLAADAESGRALRRINRFRDLRTYEEVPRAEADRQADAIRAGFSPSRWAAFKHDVNFLTSRVPAGGWQYFFIDHGYNPPPAWTVVGRLFSGMTPVEHLKWITSVDLLLAAAMFAAMAAAFGAAPCMLGLLFFSCTYSGRWPILGHSLLRFDWLAALVIGTCLLRRGRAFAAGGSMAYSAANRVFPAVFMWPCVVAAARDLWRERRATAVDRRFWLGAVVVLALLGGSALYVLGPASFRDSAEKLRLHSSTASLSSHRVGLGVALSFRGEWTRGQLDASGGIGAKARLVESLQPFTRGAGIAALLLIAAHVWFVRKPAAEYLHLGLIPLFCLQNPQVNYFNVRLLAVATHATQPERLQNRIVLPLLFLIECAAQFSHVIGNWRYGTNAVASIGLGIYCAVVLAGLAFDLVSFATGRLAAHDGSAGIARSAGRGRVAGLTLALVAAGIVAADWYRRHADNSHGSVAATSNAAIAVGVPPAIRYSPAPPAGGRDDANPTAAELDQADWSEIGAWAAGLIWSRAEPAAPPVQLSRFGGDVFVMLRRKGERHAEAWGHGHTWGDGLKAAADVVHRVRDKRPDDADALEVCLTYNRRLISLPRDQHWLTDVHRGVVGLALQRGDARAMLAPTSIIAFNLSHARVLERLRRETSAAGLPRQVESERVEVFDAVQLLVSRGRPPLVVRMFRGNRAVAARDVTVDSVRAAIHALAGWLAHQVKQDGRLTYEYWPSRGRESSSDNPIRQFMASVCFGRLAESGLVVEGVDFRELQARHLQYNLARMLRSEDDFQFLEYRGESKLGAAALAALALTERGEPSFAPGVADGLIRFTDRMWRPDGSFQTFLRPERRANDNQNFYPGETLLMWSALLQRQADADRLTRLMQSVAYYRGYHRAQPNPAFVPWHTQAYYAVWRRGHDPLLRDLIFEMNDWLIGMQQWDGLPYADLRGRFFDPDHPEYGPPHASSTGVYLEGLADAYALAREVGDAERVGRYRRAIARGVRDVLQLAFLDDVDMYYVSKREPVRGGVRTEVYDNTIRIDNVQHNLMALLKIAALFSTEDYGAAERAIH